MFCIYTQNTNARLQYVADFCSQYFDLPFTITTEEDVYKDYNGIRINYSRTALLQKEIIILPSELLQETGIKEQQLSPGKQPGYTTLFTNNSETGFDIFSGIFYLLSRYEEYLPYVKDSYGRYGHENSIAYKENFLHLPLIDIWLRAFEALIHQKFPEHSAAINEQKSSFRFQPTYDIDVAWSYKNKGLLRNLGGLAKSITKRRWAAGKHRLQVLTGKQQDPFDSYGWMSELHYEYDLKPLYFFHVGQRRNQYDKNIPTSNKEYQQLIRITAAKNKIGLHPSWFSGDDMKMLNKEKVILEKISQQVISSSRQHYIRFTIPDTFRQLIDTDIYEDYSMGYGSINGFRASVSVPFYWYDLEREQETHLLLHPFCFMDANSFYEQNQTSAEALKELMDYYNRIKGVDGILTIIWHNTFLGNDPLYKGWREVYEAFLRQIHEEENASFFLKNG